MDIIAFSTLIFSLLITISAEIYVNSRYKKYSVLKTKNGLSGQEVARKILDANGLSTVHVTETRGILSDHYDPKRKSIKLSSGVFHDPTVASASVAAHEVGHALQDKDGYFLIRLRGSLVPIVNLSSRFGYLAIMIGILFNMIDLAYVGIALLFVILLFQLVTLPVEFNASKRAIEELEKLNLLEASEIKGSNNMLKAAAYTYVASLATTVLEIMRILSMVNRKR